MKWEYKYNCLVYENVNFLKVYYDMALVIILSNPIRNAMQLQIYDNINFKFNKNITIN